MRADVVLSCFSFLFLALVGCDYVDSRAVDRERANSIYKDAMAEYTAGHLDKAIAGLERVVRAAPANSSARFQLACLLQDSKKDYLGAICNYREFLAQDRSGEKAAFARDRIAKCERALVPELMKKYDLGGNASLADENAALKSRLAAADKQRLDLEQRLEKALARAGESAGETERMRKMLLGEVSEDARRPVVKTEAELLDDERDGAEDRVRISQDVKELVIEEEQEKVTTPFEVSEKKERKRVEEKKPTEPAHEPRPSEYLVQDGDTLMKLAVRFYGRRSAWMTIRDANKAVISTDGRIRAGQKIVLP